MKNKIQEAIEATQQEIIVAAEQKFGRSLTEAERRGEDLCIVFDLCR